MGENILYKLKKLIIDDDDYDYDDDDDYDDEKNDTRTSLTDSPNRSKIVNPYTEDQMKVMIVEPKKYEEITIISDYLKQRRAVIVNLEGLLEDSATRKSMFNFMHGAVYALDGNMQKVSKLIFILAPNSIDIDADIKKDLEIKAIFPWQNKE